MNFVSGIRRHLRTGVAAAALMAAFVPALHAENMNDALVKAYLANPDLDAQRARQRGTDEQVPQALSGWRPTVSLGFSGTLADNVNSPGGQNSTNTTDSSLNITQNLYNGGGTVAQTNKAENAVKSGRATLLSTEQTVLLDAVNSYITYWAGQSVVDLAANNVKRFQQQLRATQDRFQVGEVARTDVAQAEASLAGAVSDKVTADANLAAAIADYERVIGEVPPVKIVPPKPLAKLPPSKDEAYALAESNPDIVAAQYALAAAKDDVDIAFSNLLPSVDLQGQLGYTDEPQNGLNWTRGAAIGLNVTVPLYQGGGEYALVRQNKQIVTQRAKNLDSTSRTVRQQVANAWDNLIAARAAIKSLQVQVRANSIALEGVRQEALVGTRTTLDVLDAEQALFDSQVTLVRAMRTEILQSYQLKAAVGQMTAYNLALDVQTYNPEIHYQKTRNRLFGLADVSDSYPAPVPPAQ